MNELGICAAAENLRITIGEFLVEFCERRDLRGVKMRTLPFLGATTHRCDAFRRRKRPLAQIENPRYKLRPVGDEKKKIEVLQPVFHGSRLYAHILRNLPVGTAVAQILQYCDLPLRQRSL